MTQGPVQGLQLIAQVLLDRLWTFGQSSVFILNPPPCHLNAAVLWGFTGT